MKDGEHLTPREARLHIERDRSLSVQERGWIDAHLVRCSACAGLIARIAGFGPPQSEEEAANRLGGQR